MAQPDWRTLDLDAAVLREPVPEENRVVFWLTGGVADGFRHWERIGSVPGGELPAAHGLAATAATAIRARQRVQGFFGRLLERWRPPNAGPTWVHPNGSVAEQVGPRQTDLLLVWADPEAVPVAPARIAERWPQAGPVRKIAGNLFLVAGVEPAPRPDEAAQGSPRQQAEARLAAARQARDCPRQASALTDLGVACLRGGEPHRAVQLLEDALTIARRLRDRTQEIDVLGNLGLALLAAGRPGRGA